MKSVYFIFLILLFICVKSKSQEYNYFHYDIKDGLSGITIYTIAQDKDGFLWFGTETGLSRFDGSHFKNYKATEGLNDNEIINLFVDSKNRVWIFPFKNSLYYYYNGKIHNSSNDSLVKRFHLKNEVFKASEDKDGNIFFLESDRLHILSKNGDLTEVNRIDNENFFNDGCGNLNGECNLFISLEADIQNHRIHIYEYKNGKFYFKKIIQDNNITRNTIELNSNYTLIRNKDFFEIYHLQTHDQFKIKVPRNFHTLSYIDDSCFAISTSEKTFLFNINQKQIIDSFLNYTTVNRCFKDNENNIWFATMGHGIYRLSSTKFKIYALEHNFTSVSIHAINRFKDNLYIGSAKGLLWDLRISKNIIKKIPIRITDYDVNRISAIQPLNNEILLLGTDDGIFKKDETQIKSSFERTSIKSLFLHNDSVIFASDRNVLDCSLQNFNDCDTIWRSRGTCACKLNNKYYVGTLSGLYYIENNKQHTAIALGTTYPILKDKIIAIQPSANKDLWIATENFGLICLEDNKIKYHITAINGLTSNVCRCLFFDESNLWLGTDKGISKIDISHYPFIITRFTSAEGLDCEIINCIYAQGDSVFAGTPFGVTFFNTARIQNKSICKLKLLDIESKNNGWFYRPDGIRLKANDNFLRFDYAGISFVSSNDITYYYQLKGLDDAWQSTAQSSVEFESLPAGSYLFNIYAVNKYGIKSNMISIHFTKAKLFWQLLWVQGLTIAILCFIAWIILRQRIKIIRQSANDRILHERKINELEQMALRAQMNPHFIFNSLNSIQQFIFSGNVLEANQFITDFSLLIRQTLYISGKKFINLDEEIEYLNAYLNLEQLKYENIFDFKIAKNEKIVSKNIVIPPLLLQPYVENSIRHGILNLKERRGVINIYFSMEGSLLVCVIKDNGIGRESAIKLKSNTIPGYQSKGMELVKKRIENLNIIYNTFITVFVEDVIYKNETGTCVTIKLPLSYDE
jgi:hypothetical protein